MPRARAQGILIVVITAMVIGLVAVFVMASARVKPAAAPAVQPSVQSLGERAVWLGDSFTEAAQVSAEQRFSQLVCLKFGWIDANYGQGGTGYVAEGPTDIAGRTTFPNRVQAIIDQQPDWVFVAGGINDSSQSYTTAEMRSAVQRTLEPLKAGLPEAHVVVIGPFWVNGYPVPKVLQIRDIVEAEAERLHLPFIDPIAERWITGAPRGDTTRPAGNRAKYIGTDGTHPNADGQAYFAERIEQDLVDLNLR